MQSLNIAIALFSGAYNSSNMLELGLIQDSATILLDACRKKVLSRTRPKVVVGMVLSSGLTLPARGHVRLLPSAHAAVDE